MDAAGSRWRAACDASPAASAMCAPPPHPREFPRPRGPCCAGTDGGRGSRNQSLRSSERVPHFYRPLQQGRGPERHTGFAVCVGPGAGRHWKERRCAMRKMVDCRDYPSEMNCTLVIAGEEEEVVRAASEHAVSRPRPHGFPGAARADPVEPQGRGPTARLNHGPPGAALDAGVTERLSWPVWPTVYADPPLRAAWRPVQSGGRGDVTQGRRAAGARAPGACTRPAGCGRRRCGGRSFRGQRPDSRRRFVLRLWRR